MRKVPPSLPFLVPLLAAVAVLAAGCESSDSAPGPDPVPTATLTRAQVRDRIEGGWVGQMVGVVAAGWTEFAYKGVIIPEDQVPEWDPETFFFTAWMQDDLYVEVPFVEAMLAHGPLVGYGPLGEAFVNTTFRLWHGNEHARNALERGIPAPGSGHYTNNEHCDDIDWQIEADYIGLMTPGMTHEAVELAWRHGHVIGFGDGVYGGVFVAAMHAEAFVADTLDQVIAAGLAAIPADTDFRRLLADVQDGYARNSAWEVTWQEIEDKWGDTDRCPTGLDDPYNIDAKLNAGYVLMGLLYGEGDFWDSIVISMRGGQDSDCNPSTVAGILGTLYGLSGIPAEYKTHIDWTDKKFEYTDRTLGDLVDASEALARQIVAVGGGTITGEGDAQVWEVPRRPVPMLIREQWPRQANEAPAWTDVRVAGIDGRTVRFEAAATDDDGIVSYLWAFGDLTYGDGATPEHTYLAPGTYEAHAWVTDTIGNTSWQAIPVVVP